MSHKCMSMYGLLQSQVAVNRITVDKGESGVCVTSHTVVATLRGRRLVRFTKSFAAASERTSKDTVI